MFEWLRRIWSPPKRQSHYRPVARYDAASPSTNAVHFAKADDLGPNAANSADVRARLRKFAGYEIDNNSYAKGMNLTTANEIVGTGPRLQMKLKSRDDNRRIESEFALWLLATGFADKLHTFVQAKTGRDGEGVAVLKTNPGIDHPVKLFFEPIEAAMLTTPGFGIGLSTATVDGIEFDQYGSPAFYHILKEHPGDGGLTFSNQAYSRVPARNVIHWYREDRPGQRRGIPEITPSIGLFAQLRRYGQSVLTAAEVASNLAAVLQTDGFGDTEPQNDPWDQIPIDMGTMTTLPPGWKMAAFTPTQPIANYGDFKREVLMEIARCQNMPYNVVAGDSSNSSYASGRLDFQVWRKSISITRASLERLCHERIFYAWIAEAALIPGYLPELDTRNIPHAWFYDGAPHVDPVKEAQADKVNISIGTVTLAEIYAKRGLDWEEELEQKAIEDQKIIELGLERYLPGYAMDVQKDIADQNGSDQQDTTDQQDATTEPGKPSDGSGNGFHLNGFHFVGRPQ